MRMTKRLVPQFTFYDRTGIEALLEKKAEEGWLLEKISNFGWKLKRIKPKKIHYAVTYFPKVSAFDPKPSEELLRFQEFCAHTGWKLAASTAQMQIFYNEAENPIPIETDPEIELENIEASAKKSFLPAYWAWFACSVLQMVLLLYRLSEDFIGVISSNVNLFTGVSWIILFLMSLMEILGFYSWRKKGRKAIETDGSFVPTRGFRNIVLALSGLVMICFAALAVSLGGKYGLILLICTGTYFLVLVTVWGITEGMKKLGFHAEDTRLVTIIASIVLSILLVIVMIPKVIEAIQVRWPKENQTTYTYKGSVFTSYQDNMPLKLEDLTDIGDTEYSYYFRGDESLIASEMTGNQHPHMDQLGADDLNYAIYEVKFSFLFRSVLNDLLHRFDDWYGMNDQPINYREVDADPWNADRVFQEYAGDEAENEFLLCYGNRIVFIRPDFVLNEEQMKTVAEKLGK